MFRCLKPERLGMLFFYSQHQNLKVKSKAKKYHNPCDSFLPKKLSTFYLLLFTFAGLRYDNCKIYPFLTYSVKEFLTIMKICQSCNFENAEDMRFCVECGTPLPASPMVINLQDGKTHRQSDIKTASFGKSIETQVANRQPNFTPNFPNAVPARQRSYSKILLALGGVFVLFLLLLTAGAAIVYFNWEPDKPVVIPTKTPTPTPKRIVETSTPTPTPKISPTQSPTPPESVADAGGSFEKMWVDYNVTENGQLGMRMHINFSALNLKDVESDLLIRFQYEDDSYLKTDSGAFRTKNGEVAVSQALKPAYENAVYKDLQLFMPYNEFNLSQGKYDLKMDVDLIYRNGDFIQHLNTYEFQYEEK